MSNVKKLICLLFLLAWTSSAYPATVYKWVDKEGVVNFTDDYEIVPRVYRNGIEVEEFLQEEGAPAPAHGVAVKGKEEFKSDIYGEDGTRWREKVLSWKNRLNEATSNYEKARNGLLDEGKGLIWHRYGSKTQYQMVSAGLSGMSGRLEEFKEQIAEARGMLERLSKEAKESKADPAWLE